MGIYICSVCLAGGCDSPILQPPLSHVLQLFSSVILAEGGGSQLTSPPSCLRLQTSTIINDTQITLQEYTGDICGKMWRSTQYITQLCHEIISISIHN